MKVKLSVYRYDGLRYAKPRYQIFEIDLDPRETVSGALQYIHENFDSSLAFRFTCNIQKCGECAVNVNNTPCLACEKIIEREMIIDPLPNLPVIKDLVIDRHKVIRDLLGKCKSLNKSSWLWHRQAMLSTVSTKEIRMGLCLECLCCQSVCQTVKLYPDEFVGPLGLLWFVQKLIRLGRIAEGAGQLEDLFRRCDRCGACLKACPDSEKPLAPAFSEFVRRKNNQ